MCRIMNTARKKYSGRITYEFRPYFFVAIIRKKNNNNDNAIIDWKKYTVFAELKLIEAILFH